MNSNRRIWASLATAALSVCSWSSLTQAQDSVAYQINPAHDGHIVFTDGFVPPLKRLWARDLRGQVSYPIATNGLIFVTVGNQPGHPGSRLIALSLSTGQTVWEKLIGGPYTWSNAAYDNGRLFVMNMAGVVQAFNADTGGLSLWASQLPGQSSFETAPTAAGGYVYVAGSGNGGTLYSLDEQTGTLSWKSKFVITGQGCSPAYGDGGLFVSYVGDFGRFDPNTGDVIWGKNGRITGGWGSTPVYFSKHLYVRDSQNGNVIADSDTGNGKEHFVTSATPAFWSDTFGNGFMMTRRSSSLSSTNLATGAISWTFTGDHKLSSAPLVINDTVAIGSSNGQIFVVDAATGTELWSANAGAPILNSDSDNLTPLPWTGLGAASEALIVPASDRIAVYVEKHPGRGRK